MGPNYKQTDMNILPKQKFTPVTPVKKLSLFYSHLIKPSNDPHLYHTFNLSAISTQKKGNYDALT